MLSLLLTGCAQLPPANFSDTLASTAYIDGLTLYPDEQNQCGPSTLASLLDFYDQSFDFESLSQALVIPEKNGSIRAEMKAQARRHGLIAYQVAPKIEPLFEEIARGNPVIVMQNLAFDRAPQWHYAIVRGFDLANNTVTLQSADQTDYVIPIALFRRTWARAKNWAMVPMPVGQLPESASLFSAMDATFDMEQIKQFSAAYQNYTVIAERWPTEGHGVVFMGLANTAYRLGRFTQAKAHLVSRLKEHPATPDTWNNLSHVMHALECPAAAVSAAYCATELAPNQPVLDNTLRQMSSKVSLGQTDAMTQCQIPSCPINEAVSTR